MSFDQEGNGLGRPTPDMPDFQYQPPLAPPPWQPAAPYHVAPTPPPQATSRPLVIVIVVICMVIMSVIAVATTQHNNAPSTIGSVLPPPPTLYPPITQQPTVAATSDWQARPPAKTPYELDQENLTAKESAYYGHVKQGDCLNDPPDDMSKGVSTFDCAKPHLWQVAGFVDMSEGLPDRSDIVTYELAIGKRCNYLKAALGVPPALTRIIAISYPDEKTLKHGVSVALCWVTSHNKWVGSVIDGTAAPA